MGASDAGNLQQDITLYEIKEAAFPNARDFSLVVGVPSSSSTTTSNHHRGSKQKQQQQQATVVLSASWDEPVIPISSSSSKKNKKDANSNNNSNKAATFEYLQKLTNRFIRKLQEHYPGVVIKTGSAANQDLMQLTAHVQNLTQKLGDLKNKTHKMVNEIADNNNNSDELLSDVDDLLGETDDDDEEDDDIFSGQGKKFREAQQRALFGLMTWILQKPTTNDV